MKKIIVLLVLLVPALANSDVSVKLTFIMGTSNQTRVEVLRDVTVIDVTTTVFPCANSNWCAVVAQPVTPGVYQYSIRVTDYLGTQRTSNQLPFIIPSMNAPTNLSVVAVITTGTPTPAATATPG